MMRQLQNDESNKDHVSFLFVNFSFIWGYLFWKLWDDMCDKLHTP